MGHWSLEDFVKEVQDVNQYIQERPQAVMLASSLVSGLVEKIKLSNLWTCGNLLAVTKAVKSTQLEDQHKNTLLKALDDKTMEQQKKAVKLTMVPQSLTQIHNYLSASEWKNAQQSSMAALQAISTRLRLCGVKALKEDTKKWCTALMVHFEMERAAGEKPAYTTIYRMSQEMATAFQCSQVEARAEPMVQYPASPLDLGEAWLNQVYDPKDMPTNRDVPSLLLLVKDHIPIRNTSALLSKEKSQVVPSSGPNEPMDKMMGFWQQLGSALFQGHMPSTQPSPNTGELLLHSFQPKRLPRLDQTSAGGEPAQPAPQAAQPALQLALPAPPPEKPKLADPQPPPEKPKQEAAPPEKNTEEPEETPRPAQSSLGHQNDPSLEEYEVKTFQMLQAKKAAAKAKANPKAKATAKAKAAAKSKVKKDQTKPKAKAKSKQPAKGCSFADGLGCPRCRGNSNGCSVCKSPLYGGIRCPGRQAWKAYMAKRGKTS